jgi:hypothetical protein
VQTVGRGFALPFNNWRAEPHANQAKMPDDFSNRPQAAQFEKLCYSPVGDNILIFIGADRNAVRARERGRACSRERVRDFQPQLDAYGQTSARNYISAVLVGGNSSFVKLEISIITNCFIENVNDKFLLF